MIDCITISLYPKYIEAQILYPSIVFVLKNHLPLHTVSVKQNEFKSYTIPQSWTGQQTYASKVHTYEYPN